RRTQVRARLEQLEAKHADPWGAGGAVAGAFGDAYGELGDFDNAIRWYRRAVAAEDGGASMHALEQLGNLRARRGRNAGGAAERQSEIETAIDLLQRVVAIEPTSERASLLGSAYKRLAMLEPERRRGRRFRSAIVAMAKHYRQAEELARSGNADNLFYAMQN